MAGIQIFGFLSGTEWCLVSFGNSWSIIHQIEAIINSEKILIKYVLLLKSSADTIMNIPQL